MTLPITGVHCHAFIKFKLKQISTYEGQFAKLCTSTMTVDGRWREPLPTFVIAVVRQMLLTTAEAGEMTQV